ncbi:MAG: hypothetical protein AABP62_29655 [Planctomycetota bacterium]
MTQQRPVLATAPSRRHPVTQRPSEQKRWTFSFRFFNQIDYFGLSKSDADWFVSLLARLATLSQEPIERMRADPTTQNAWRYHPVNWSQKNIPIQRTDLTWVTPEYRDNEAEYPLVQFMISRTLGRVVGFWDESDVFNIVLLDPLHNIWPTKNTGYRVDPCSPMDCRFTALLGDILQAQGIACNGNECPSHNALKRLPTFERLYTALLIHVGEELQDKLAKSLENGWDLHQLFELGLECAIASGDDQKSAD